MTAYFCQAKGGFYAGNPLVNVQLGAKFNINYPRPITGDIRNLKNSKISKSAVMGLRVLTDCVRPQAVVYRRTFCSLLEKENFFHLKTFS